MRGQQSNIPLNSPVSLGNYDIVMDNEIEFKNKNSVVFRGVLSNLKKSSGDGILSTSGKTIEITEKGLKAGNTLFNFEEPMVTANEYESISSFRDILFARRTTKGLSYIRRPSPTMLKVHTTESEFDLTVDDTVTLTVDGKQYEAKPYSINGFIAQNEGTETGLIHPNLIMVTRHYYNSEVNRYYNKYSIYSLSGSLLHTWEDSFYGSGHEYTSGSETLALGGTLTGYVRHYKVDNIVYNYIYWGFDDPDMRKRFIFRSWYYFDERLEGARVEDWDAGTEPEDSGYLFNENQPDVETKIPTFSSDGLVYSGREIVYFGEEKQVTWGIFPLVWGFGLISDKGHAYGEPLLEKTPKNQTEQTARARGLWNTKYRTLKNGVIVVEVPQDSKRYWNGTTYVTESKTRWEMNSGLGVNPTTYGSGGQSGLGNWTGTPFTRYVDDNEDTAQGYDYNWVLSIDLSIPEVWQLIPAVEDGDSRLPSEVAHLTFFNFSDIFGKFKKEPTDSEQVFPHMRFFMNVQQERGKYWDYGKGWNCMTVDQLYINRYSSYGVAVWETPLSIVYNTVEEKYRDNLNFTSHSYDEKYTRSLDTIKSRSFVTFDEDIFKIETELPKVTLSSTNYPYNSKSSFIGTSEFQAAFETYSSGTSMTYWGQVLRLHPITTTMQDADNFTYSNHSWTGFGDNSALSTLTHTYNLDENIHLGVYASIPTALSAYKTLLFTPQDLSDNYCFDISDNGGYYITRFNESSIESVCINNNATWKDVKVDKVADYEFRLNLLGQKNLLVEDIAGNFVLQNAFSPYIMDTYMENYFPINLPGDEAVSSSNGIWYFGAGVNTNLNGEISESSTFLLPSITLNNYVSTSDVDNFNRYTLDDRNGKLRADLWCFGAGSEVDEFWTFNRATTDILYKNTKYIDEAYILGDKFKSELANTSWWAEDVVIYPVGIVSKVSGVDYTTPTVDAGGNYSARFYRNNNKTFIVFNQKDLVYFGNSIFTVQSGNYYYSGQAIYYLGSKDDYSQNIFTAYAVGMKFLANSSSEAYFYSMWDKSLYLFTASNTLQKSDSLAAMGNIVDSLYSSLEQSLYILFEGGKLLCKTQDDSMIIDGVKGNKLQSTAYGCEVLGDETFEIYNPYYWNDTLPLRLETEWLGSKDLLLQFPYADIVLLDETEKSSPTVYAELKTIDGTKVIGEEREFNVTNWENHLSRIRVEAYRPDGNAAKLVVRSDDEIHIMGISLRTIQVSDVPQGSRSLRG